MTSVIFSACSLFCLKISLDIHIEPALNTTTVTERNLKTIKAHLYTNIPTNTEVGFFM